MGRVIGAVIAGYVLMMAIIFGLATLAWMALGTNGAFRQDSWRTTGLWIAITAVCALVAAIPASRVCSLIARGDRRALRGLVGLILVLGIIFAMPVITRAPGTVDGRAAVVSMQEAITHAAQPVWLALLLPVLGMIGAVLGWKHRPVEI
jgi:hypothetical protein